MDLDNHTDAFTAHTGQTTEESVGLRYTLRSCQDLMIVETMVIDGIIQKKCIQRERATSAFIVQMEEGKP